MVALWAPTVGWAFLGKTGIPLEFTAVVNDTRFPICVLDLVTDNYGRVDFDRITFARRKGDSPLQVAKLRAPLDRYRRDAVGLVTHEVAEIRDGRAVLRRGEDTFDTFADEYDRVVRRTPHRGRKTSDDDLERVAEIYRAAVAAGRSPAKAIVAEIPSSEEHARRKVRLARERGFLGPAIPGRAGEQPIDKEGDRNA